MNSDESVHTEDLLDGGQDLPSLDELLAEAKAQAEGAEQIRQWIELLDKAEALPAALALAALTGLVDAATAYAGPLAGAIQRLAESALRRLTEKRA